jgi:hypothetical protein
MCQWDILFIAPLGINRVERLKNLIVMDLPRMALAKDQGVHHVV